MRVDSDKTSGSAMQIPKETLAEIKDHLLLGRKLVAVRMVREQDPALGLKEAIDVVEGIEASLAGEDRDAWAAEAAARHRFDAAAFARAIGWPDIVQEVRDFGGAEPRAPGAPPHRAGVVRIRPSDRRWPEIRLLGSEDFLNVGEVFFADWDAAYTRDELVECVADLVARRLCVVQELDAGGEVLTAALLDRDEQPDWRSAKTVRRCRIFFDREPADEPIGGHTAPS